MHGAAPAVSLASPVIPAETPTRPTRTATDDDLRLARACASGDTFLPLAWLISSCKARASFIHLLRPNLVSISDLDGVALIVSLPNLTTQFGYGYAIDAEISVPAATTIDLFAGSTPVGSISFAGIPDPIFTGGFAGVASDTPFDRAVLTFSDVSDAFAVDNVTFSANKASDEGQTLILLSAGVSFLLFLRARRREFRFSYH